jgi:hypothetical protein
MLEKFKESDNYKDRVVYIETTEGIMSMNPE